MCHSLKYNIIDSLKFYKKIMNQKMNDILFKIKFIIKNLKCLLVLNFDLLFYLKVNCKSCYN